MKYYKILGNYKQILKMLATEGEIPEGAIEISKKEYDQHQDKDDDIVI